MLTLALPPRFPFRCALPVFESGGSKGKTWKYCTPCNSTKAAPPSSVLSGPRSVNSGSRPTASAAVATVSLLASAIALLVLRV